MNTSVVFEKYFSQLPEYAQNELIDFAEFLLEKHQQQLSATVQLPRKAGLHVGMVKIAEDFDEPLDEDFWLGQ